MTQENIKNMLSPNKEDMHKHIEFIMHGMNDYKDGMIEISYGDEQNNPTISKLFSVADKNVINEIMEFSCDKNSMGRNVYIVPAYQDPESPADRRGNSNQFYATNTIAIDIDNNDEKKRITSEELRLKYAACRPGIVIVTGRKPNLRTWLVWKLTEPITDKEELRNVVTGIIDHLDGDPAAKDATRLTRLGGLIAWATGKKAKVGRVNEVIETNVTGEAPVNVQKLKNAFPKKNITPRKPTGLNFESSFERRSDQEVRDMLEFIPDYDGSRLEWLSVLMALNDGGYDFEIAREWSAKSKTKYDYDDLVRTWNSLTPGKGISMGTLAFKSKGYLRISDNSEIHEAQKIPIESKPAIKNDDTNTTQKIKFTGLIDDTIEDILATSQKPQPELATLNVLAALGAVYGRRYASPMDTRTNIYTVGVAPTGAGKDHSRKYIKNLMLRAKMESLIGDDSIVSGAGLLKSISKKTSQIMHIDEFGMVLSEIKNKNAASYMKVCTKILTELYSSSNGFYYGGQYADPKRESVKILNPNLCIYGTTTLNKYIESLDKSVIESGEINRYIIIKAENDFPKRILNLKRTKATEEIVDRWNALIPSLGTLSCDETTPVMVTWDWLDDKINELFIFQDRKIEEEPLTGALWARYAENVIKIAMISAITKNHLRPNIEIPDIQIGEALILKSVNYMKELASTQMYDSEHEKICNKILDIVKSFGQRMSKKELSNRTREIEPRIRMGALEALEERGAILIEKEKMMSGQISYYINLK